jgi:hypothetical protein
MESRKCIMPFAEATFATWRVTHLLAREDGPGDVIAHLHSRLQNTAFGKLLDCFDCLSLWVAALISILSFRAPRQRVVAWLALSGAACLLERMLHEPVIIQPLPEIAEEL